MFLLRISRTAPAARVAASSIASRAPFSTNPRRFATSDYGSGAQNVDKSLEKESRDKEHPGPPPPSTGSSGSSSESKNDSTSSGHEQSSSSKDSKAQPKILNESPPKEAQQSEEVRKHNEDFKQRADRPVEGIKK